MSDPEVCGLVLAGGHSRRFGQDKAIVQIDGQALLDRTVQMLEQCLSRVYVSVRPDQKDEPRRQSHPLILDRLTDFGPASGILSAHDEQPEVAWLVVACDFPQLDQPTIETLLRNRDPDCPAIAYRSSGDGLPEPLCALYEPGTLARFRRQIEPGANSSARRLLMGINTKLIDLCSKGALRNMNTPEDFAPEELPSDELKQKN